MSLLVIAAGFFGAGLALAAVMPQFWTFSVVLVGVGLAAQTFTTTANGALQLWADAAMRGRVIAMFLAVAMGGTPLGAPLAGWVADSFGPRWAMLLGAFACVVAAVIGYKYLVKHRGLQLQWRGWHLHCHFDIPELDEAPQNVKATEMSEVTESATEQAADSVKNN